jgi:hypothetical protein
MNQERVYTLHLEGANDSAEKNPTTIETMVQQLCQVVPRWDKNEIDTSLQLPHNFWTKKQVLFFGGLASRTKHKDLHWFHLGIVCQLNPRQSGPGTWFHAKANLVIYSFTNIPRKAPLSLCRSPMALPDWYYLHLPSRERRRCLILYCWPGSLPEKLSRSMVYEVFFGRGEITTHELQMG